MELMSKGIVNKLLHGCGGVMYTSASLLFTLLTQLEAAKELAMQQICCSICRRPATARTSMPSLTFFPHAERRCMTSLRCDGGDPGQVSETLANMEALERMFELRTHLEMAQAKAEAKAGQR